jgi:deoxyxylulose-5-phosphate synthase
MCLRNSYELNGIKYKQMAIEDFVLGYGTYEELCEKIGLSSKNIKRQIVNLLEK